MDAKFEAELDAVITTVASETSARGAAAMYQTLAVVGALAEARLIDPMKVVAWAKFFASGQASSPMANAPPETRAIISKQLLEFAEVIRAMSAAPPGAGKS